MNELKRFLENFTDTLSVVVLEDNKYDLERVNIQKEDFIKSINSKKSEFKDFSFEGFGRNEFYISYGDYELTIQVYDFELDTQFLDF